MILNIKENKLDGRQIGFRETLTLSALTNNYCNSCEELARFVYNDELNDNTRQCIYDNIDRLRKRGLHIERISTNGFRLIETIYIDY